MNTLVLWPLSVLAVYFLAVWIAIGALRDMIDEKTPSRIRMFSCLSLAVIVLSLLTGPTTWGLLATVSIGLDILILRFVVWRSLVRGLNEFHELICAATDTEQVLLSIVFQRYGIDLQSAVSFPATFLLAIHGFHKDGGKLHNWCLGRRTEVFLLLERESVWRVSWFLFSLGRLVEERHLFRGRTSLTDAGVPEELCEILRRVAKETKFCPESEFENAHFFAGVVALATVARWKQALSLIPAPS